MAELNYHRLLSRPLRVRWAGWETDTYSLQQAGWRLSAEQDPFQNAMRLAMVHDGQNMQGISKRVRFDFHSNWSMPEMQLEHAVFDMHIIGREVFIHEHGEIDWRFAPIDATPTYATHKVSRMEDIFHFAAPLVRTKEIIIPDESVPELMERILKLQQPARTERIRKEMREPKGYEVDARPQQKMHAQIISLAA